MSDMKCPHCGEELVDQGAKIGNEDRVFACENISCAYYGQNLDLEIWQDLIAGQEAQDRLKKARELYKRAKGAQMKIQDLFPLFKKPGWVAMDSNKRWYWYAYEPTINRRQETFIGLSPKDLSCMFNITPFEGDWKDSLMEYGNTHEQVKTK